MPSTPRRAAIAVAAVLTAVTLVACSSGDGARNAVAVGGTFQFHSPGGQTEIIYAEKERAPLPDFSDPSLMEEGLPVTGDGPVRPFNRCPHRGYIAVDNVYRRFSNSDD